MGTKKLVIQLAVILALVGILLGTFGCSKAEPTTTAPITTAPANTTTAPTSNPTTAPVSGEKIELKVNIAWSATSNQNKHFERLKTRLEQATNGRLTLRIYPGSTLVPEKEMWNGVTTGLADICAGSRYETRNNPIMDNIMVFTVGVPTAIMGAKISQDLYDQFPAFQKEWEQARLLYFVASGANHIHTVAKQVPTLADLKGLQIRSAPAGGMPDLLKALGASPVSLPAGEVYTALQKKTVEGCSFPYEALQTFKLAEVSKYSTDINLWAVTSNFVAMNKEKYNSLPADLQKALNDNLDWARDDLNNVFEQADKDALVYAKGLGLEVVTVTDKDAWYAAIAPYQASVAKKLDDSGTPGTQVMQFFKDRIKYYESQK